VARAPSIDCETELNISLGEREWRFDDAHHRGRVKYRAGSVRLVLAVKAHTARFPVIGYEILRRVSPSEVPAYPLDPRTERAVLGARGGRYLVPPRIDVFELGLLGSPGPYELLPIDADDKALWQEVVHLLVTSAQAERQRALLLRAYRALHTMILEADELEASITAWSRRGAVHPVFGILRLETIEVWRSTRQASEPLTQRALDALHIDVARRVAARIHAHIIR
jgi:hypothetical protein